MARSVEVRETDANLAALRKVLVRGVRAADVLLAPHEEVARGAAFLALARPVVGDGDKAAEREGIVRAVIAVDAAAGVARAVVCDRNAAETDFVLEPDAAAVAL